MKALFPGSFDPITNGHVEIIRRGLMMFEHITVGIGLNSKKVTKIGRNKILSLTENAQELLD